MIFAQQNPQLAVIYSPLASIFNLPGQTYSYYRSVLLKYQSPAVDWLSEKQVGQRRSERERWCGLTFSCPQWKLDRAVSNSPRHGGVVHSGHCRGASRQPSPPCPYPPAVSASGSRTTSHSSSLPYFLGTLP